MINRFDTALYTPKDLATFLAIPQSTVRSWAAGSPEAGDCSGLITELPPEVRHGPRIPFVGLAEAYVLRAIRETGVSMQRIRPVLARLVADESLPHVLASERLYTDGDEILLDVASCIGQEDSIGELVVARNGQRVLHEVLRGYLEKLQFEEGYAQIVPLTRYGSGVIADPRRGFGQPIFDESGARVEDALDLFQAGASPQEVADEFGIELGTVHAVLRGQLRAA